MILENARQSLWRCPLFQSKRALSFRLLTFTFCSLAAPHNTHPPFALCRNVLDGRTTAFPCPGTENFPSIDTSVLATQKNLYYNSDLNQTGIIFNVRGASSPNRADIRFVTSYTFTIPAATDGSLWKFESHLGYDFITGGSLGMLLQYSGVHSITHLFLSLSHTRISARAHEHTSTRAPAYCFGCLPPCFLFLFSLLVSLPLLQFLYSLLVFFLLSHWSNVSSHFSSFLFLLSPSYYSLLTHRFPSQYHLRHTRQLFYCGICQDQRTYSPTDSQPWRLHPLGL